MERYASLLSFDAQLNVHNSCMTELEQWTVVLPNFHLHAQNATLSELIFTAIFSKNEVHNLNIHIFFFHMRPYSTGQKKGFSYLVGNLVATNWPIEKALHAIGCNQIRTKWPN